MPNPKPCFTCLVVLLATLAHAALAGGDDRIGVCRNAVPSSIDPCALRMRADDEIWIVSSRCIYSCESINLARLECFRWSGTDWSPDQWNRLADEHREDCSRQTVIYLHGNRTNIDWSALRGLQVFDQVFGDAPDRSAVRFVIWSWPADPQPRRFKEYRENSERSVWEGNVLAAFLHELGGASTIGLFGYSFGAQAVTVAAEKACRSASVDADVPNHFRIVCVAAAYQKPWSQVVEPLAGCEECAIESLQLSNSSDRALRAHRFLSRYSSDSYAAKTSVDERSPAGRPAYVDISQFVGRRHNVVLYVSCSFVADQIQSAILGPNPTTTFPMNEAPAE